MASLFIRKPQKDPDNEKSGLANIYAPTGGKYSYVNVVGDYTWTLNEYAKSTAPIVILREYQINETAIRRSTNFYTTGGQLLANGINPNSPAAANVNNVDILSPYNELYQKEFPTGFVYAFPYFSDINFEVNTPMWQSLDTLDKMSSFASGAAGVIGGEGLAKGVEDAIKFGGSAAMAGLATGYPKVGITDRPRLWDSHEPRSIEINFPLFNTVSPDDWKKNRELCELLVNQNLYNKRDFITSIPPVFYEVLVVGQHYSYASCVTNITVYNKGNMRLIQDTETNRVINVPDVYEIKMTLTDMVMPSKNLFQAIDEQKVISTLIDPARVYVESSTLGSTVLGRKAADLVIGGGSTITKGIANTVGFITGAN
jgi:hypothetical protein